MDMKIDFNERPFIVIWEVTQACDLACLHCRASAQCWRNPLELSTEEGKRLIDEVAVLKVPVFVLTGGDPLKRPDIFDLVEYAAARGIRVSLTPSATPLLTNDAITRLKRSGLARLAISLDGPTAQGLLTLYIGTGLVFMLLPGTFLGVWNLISISSRRAALAVSPSWIQAHGHAQIFGWIGSFILGIGFYSIPKLRHAGPFS